MIFFTNCEREQIGQMRKYSMHAGIEQYKQYLCAKRPLGKPKCRSEYNIKPDAEMRT